MVKGHISERDTYLLNDLLYRATYFEDDGTGEETDQAFPEISAGLRWAREHPEDVTRITLGYQRLCEDMLHLDEGDICMCDAAQVELTAQGVSSGVSHHSLREFLSIMTPKSRGQLSLLLSQLPNPEYQLYRYSIENLGDMLTGGHQLFGGGRMAQDGDSRADGVIWGHTRISDPEALFHFVYCHYIERYVCQALARNFIQVTIDGWDLSRNIANGKDAVLDAMTATLLLRDVCPEKFGDITDPGSVHARILEMWLRPKTEGGLGWIKPAQLEAFRRAAQAR